jgi:hypothetical protein
MNRTFIIVITVIAIIIILLQCKLTVCEILFNFEIKLFVLRNKCLLHTKYLSQMVTFDQSYRYHDTQNVSGVQQLFTIRLVCVGRDSLVDIATRNGGGFRSRSDRPWGPSSLLYNGYRVSFSRVKRPGRCVHQPPRSSADFKEEAELSFCALMTYSSVYLTFYRMSFCTSQLGLSVSSISICRQPLLSFRNDCRVTLQYAFLVGRKADLSSCKTTYYDLYQTAS